MAIPAYVGSGAVSGGLSTISVAWPGTESSGDVALLVLGSANQAITIPSGWTGLSSSPQGTGTAGAAGGVMIAVAYKIVGSSESSVSVADSGDYNVGQIHVFSGVDTSTPFDVQTGSTAAASASISLTGVTTTVADALICNILGTDGDATSATITAGPTNANLSSLTLQQNVGTAAGSGGTLLLVTGGLATAGATGATTLTQSTSRAYAFVTVALNPAASGANAVTSDLDDSYIIRVAINQSLADSYVVRASAAQDLTDSAFIRAAVVQSLADSYVLRAAVQASLADSYEILSAGVVASDLSDAYTIRAAIAQDLTDSATIKAAVQQSLADAYAIASAVQASLADSYAILASGVVAVDLEDSYVIRAAVVAALSDAYQVGDYSSAKPRLINAKARTLTIDAHARTLTIEATP